MGLNRVFLGKLKTKIIYFQYSYFINELSNYWIIVLEERPLDYINLRRQALEQEHPHSAFSNDKIRHWQTSTREQLPPSLEGGLNKEEASGEMFSLLKKQPRRKLQRWTVRFGGLELPVSQRKYQATSKSKAARFVYYPGSPRVGMKRRTRVRELERTRAHEACTFAAGEGQRRVGLAVVLRFLPIQRRPRPRPPRARALSGSDWPASRVPNELGSRSSPSHRSPTAELTNAPEPRATKFTQKSAARLTASLRAELRPALLRGCFGQFGGVNMPSALSAPWKSFALALLLSMGGAPSSKVSRRGDWERDTPPPFPLSLGTDAGYREGVDVAIFCGFGYPVGFREA